MRPAERALVLLCCRLGEELRPLSPAEFAQVQHLLAQPAEFEANAQVTPEFLASLGMEKGLAARIAALLDRPHQPERYFSHQPEISVLTRLSPEFPRRLRCLGRDCPPVLFCKGDVSLLQKPAISLVGSRLLLERGERFAERVGRLAAREGYVLVSGNAVGADRCAQNACLAAGGQVISVVPDALERYHPGNNCLFFCDEGYDCGFTTTRALRRNHLIHALGEKVFVAQCPACSGGTWAGSEYNLRRALSPLYVLQDGTPGMRALEAMGAAALTDELPSIRHLRPTQLSIFD